MTSSEVQQRAARIKLLLMDCDGVLTDGQIWIFENGSPFSSVASYWLPSYYELRLIAILE